MDLRPDAASPVRVAHRGGNTRRSLRAALAAGVDWIEIDVWLHYGRLVARHDATLWRLPITLSRRSVGVQLLPAPQLDRLIQATASSGTRLLVDLKGRSTALPIAIVETLRRHDALARSALCTQEWGPLEAARALGDDVHVVYSLGQPEHLIAFLARRQEGTVPPWTSCSHRLLTPATVAALKDAGSAIIAWTVDDERRARDLLAWGVDGITSNNYAMLARLGQA